MGFFEKLFGRRDPTPAAPDPMDKMREAMDLARFARRAEDYDRAYAALEQAMQIADEQKDTHSVTVIALHQADVLIEQGQYDEAEKLLQTVQQAAESVNQRGFTSYALVSLGNLYQGQGDWSAARDAYEQARDVAARVDATGPEGRALGHLADVYLYDNNASYAVHLLEEALPKINDAGDLELSSYFVGRLGEAKLLTGETLEGRRLLERALRLGEQMRDTRMVRRWIIALGDTAYDAGTYDEALLFYTRGRELLGDVPDIAAEHVRITTRLSELNLGLGERETALEHAQRAVEGAQALDDMSALARAQGALGKALRALGRNTEAIPHLEVAVEQAANEADALHIEALRQLAAAQQEAGQPDTARATLQRALELAQNDNELTLPLAAVYRDFGLHYNRQGQPREAIEMWVKALAIYQDENDSTQSARVLCDLANTRRQLGITKRAMTDYENALVALNHVDDLATRGLVLANAANAYTDQGDTESSAAFFRESIDISRKLSDRQAETTRLGNYAYFLIGTGEPRKAVEKLTRALEISEELGLTLHVAIQTDNLGLAYDALSQYKTALGYHETALDKLDEMTEPPVRWRALFQANTADTKLALGLLDEAAPLSDEALTSARASNDFEVIVIALLAVGRATLRRSLPSEATQHITEALSIAQRAGLRRLQAEGYHLLSETQAASDDRDTAKKSWEQAARLYRMVGAPQTKLTPHWLSDAPPAESPSEIDDGEGGA